MHSYIIAEIDIKDPETYERYKAMAPASIAKYGGTYVVRGATTTKLEGGWTPKRCGFRRPTPRAPGGIPPNTRPPRRCVSPAPRLT